jgi:hypothetical protein
MKINLCLQIWLEYKPGGSIDLIRAIKSLYSTGLGPWFGQVSKAKCSGDASESSGE